MRWPRQYFRNNVANTLTLLDTMLDCGVGLAVFSSSWRMPFGGGPRRPGDPPALVAEPGRTGAVLGWAPRRSDLTTVVGTAWRWHEALARGRGDTGRGCRRAG